MDKIYIASLVLGTIYIVLCTPNYWGDGLSKEQKELFGPFMLAYFFGLGGMFGFYEDSQSFIRFGTALGMVAIGWLFARNHLKE